MKDWEYIDNFKERVKELEVGKILTIDTRDFYFIINNDLEERLEKKYGKILKQNSKVVYKTEEEIYEKLVEWEKKSGGKADWRCIQDNLRKGVGWFKYADVFKTEKGLVVFDRNNNYRSFENLDKYLGFDKELLGTH